MLSRTSLLLCLGLSALATSAAASELRLVAVTGQDLPGTGGGTLERFGPIAMAEGGLVVLGTHVLDGDAARVVWNGSDGQLVRVIAEGDPLPDTTELFEAASFFQSASFNADSLGNFTYVTPRGLKPGDLYKIGLSGAELIARTGDNCPAPFASDTFGGFLVKGAIESGWIVDTQCDGVTAHLGSGLEFLVHEMDTLPYLGRTENISLLNYLSTTAHGAFVFALTVCTDNPCPAGGGGGFYAVDSGGARLLIARGAEGSAGEVLDWQGAGRAGFPEAKTNLAADTTVMKIARYVQAPINGYAAALYLTTGGGLTEVGYEGDGVIVDLDIPNFNWSDRWWVASDGSFVGTGTFNVNGTDTRCLSRYRSGAWSHVVCVGDPLPDQPQSTITYVGRAEANSSGQLAIEVAIDGTCQTGVCTAFLFEDGNADLSLVAAPNLLFDDGFVVHVMDGELERAWDGGWFNDRGEMLFVSYHANRTDPALFIAIPEQPEIDENEGSIRVSVKSSQPLATVDDIDVSSGLVTLYKQTRGIRPRGASETDEDYAAYLGAEQAGWEQVDTLLFANATSDIVTFDAVATKELTYVGPLQVERWARFAVVVTDGTVEEFVDPADLSQGTKPTYFVSNAIYNLKPDFSPPVDVHDLELDPLPPVRVKQELVVKLGELGPGNYLEPENLVEQWLQTTFIANPTNVTPSQAEALRRAINAERIVYSAALDSKELIKLMLDGVANLVGDLFDDFVGVKNKDISDRQDRLDALRRGEITASEFAGVTGNAYSDYITKINNIELDKQVAMSESVELMNKSLKMYKPRILWAAAALGIDQNRAEFVAERVPQLLKVVMGYAAAGNWRGAAKAAVKIIMEEIVKALADPLFDSSQDPLSYTGITRGSLARSLTLATGWNTADPVQFNADKLVFFMNWRDFNDQTTLTIKATEALQATAGVADITGEFLSIVGKFHKGAAIVGKVAEVMKYLLNSGSVIVPALHVYGTAPDRVEQGVQKAFGN